MPCWLTGVLPRAVVRIELIEPAGNFVVYLIIDGYCSWPVAINRSSRANSVVVHIVLSRLNFLCAEQTSMLVLWMRG